MTPKHWLRAAATAAVFAGILFAGLVISSTRLRAHDQDDEDSEVRIGFEIAPVHLNLAGKNRELVGLGSYIVNAQADCNGCHSAGPATEFAPGGNPYFNQPTKVNPDTYLGGGRDFVEYRRRMLERKGYRKERRRVKGTDDAGIW